MVQTQSLIGAAFAVGGSYFAVESLRDILLSRTINMSYATRMLVAGSATLVGLTLVSRAAASQSRKTTKNQLSKQLMSAEEATAIHAYDHRTKRAWKGMLSNAPGDAVINQVDLFHDKHILAHDDAHRAAQSWLRKNEKDQFNEIHYMLYQIDAGKWGMEYLALDTVDAEGLTFHDWSDQEMMTHGEDDSFEDWVTHEIDSHGNVSLRDWADDEEESHLRRYGAEADDYVCECGGTELRYVEWADDRLNGFFCMNCGLSPCGVSETDDRPCTCNLDEFFHRSKSYDAETAYSMIEHRDDTCLKDIADSLRDQYGLGPINGFFEWDSDSDGNLTLGIYDDDNNRLDKIVYDRNALAKALKQVGHRYPIAALKDAEFDDPSDMTCHYCEMEAKDMGMVTFPNGLAVCERCFDEETEDRDAEGKTRGYSLNRFNKRSRPSRDSFRRKGRRSALRSMMAAESDDDDTRPIPDREPSRGAPDLWFAEDDLRPFTPQEAVEYLRSGDNCVWLIDYADENYGDDERPHYDYPVEDPDDLETMIAEGVFDKDIAANGFVPSIVNGTSYEIGMWKDEPGGIHPSFYESPDWMKGMDEEEYAAWANAWNSRSRGPFTDKDAEESVFAGTEFTCDCGAVCTVDADTEIAYGPGGYDLRCGRNDDCRGDEKVLGAESFDDIYCRKAEKTKRWTDGRYRCGSVKNHAGDCSAWSRSGSGKQHFKGYLPCEHMKAGKVDCDCILGDGVDDSLGAKLSQHPLFRKKNAESTQTTFPPIFKKATTGKIQEWRIRTEQLPDGNWAYISSHGQVGGSMTEGKGVVIKAGKQGRTIEEQANAEAASKWKKKKDSGYFETVDEAKNNLVIMPMLAHDHKKRSHNISWPAIGQPKLDGIRCLARLDADGKVSLTSRKNKPFPGMDHIRDELATRLKSLGNSVGSPFPNDIVIDGELYADPDQLTFQQVTGLVRRDNKTKEQLEDERKLKLNVYDAINLQDLDMDFTDRYDLISDNLRGMDSITLVENTPLPDPDSITPLHDQFVTQGYEGLMIRNIEGPYKLNGRSANLQKYKSFKDEEYEIVGYEEGKGNYEGTVIWICKTPEGKLFSIKPNGTHEQRSKLFDEADSHIGKMITVRFFELTDGGVPRFPTGGWFRDYEAEGATTADEKCDLDYHLRCHECRLCLDCNLEADAGGNVCRFCTGESIERFDAFSISDRPVSVSFGKGTSGNAKMKAVFTDGSGDTKTTQFGYKGMSDYTKHGDEGRKSSYLARHGAKSSNENWNDPTTAGALSRWVLWNKKTLAGSKKAFKDKFNLRAEDTGLDSSIAEQGYQQSPFITEAGRKSVWLYEPDYSITEEDL